jgi:ribosomal protein S18 acetylase RimI-like enzyme
MSTPKPEVTEWPREGREALKEILDESFEGWYLYHSRRKLVESDVVLVASSGSMPLGLSMLELLGRGAGYVYYMAVRKTARNQGIGALLLDKSLDFFRSHGCDRVFAAVEHDNIPSQRLFSSRGFVSTNFSYVSKIYGQVHALMMYRRMAVVYGETLLMKII